MTPDRSSAASAHRPQGVERAPMVACAAVATGCGATLAAPRMSFTTPSEALVFGALVAVAVAVVVALPMVPLRMGLLLTVGGTAFAVVLRGSTTTAGALAPLLVLGWATGSVASVALAERSTVDRLRPLPGSPPRSGSGDTVAGVAVTMLVGVLLAALITPAVNRADRSDREDGQAPDAGAGASAPSLLRSSSSLDMTGRPRLSDRVVMTVRADRPAFWRGQTYDAWDGATWTNTDAEPRGIGSAVPPDPYDIGARTGERLTQQVTIEAPYADLLFAAASPVEVRRAGVTYAHPDGTLSTTPIGQGAGYTVVSRRLPVTVDDLRAANGPAPAGLLDRYAAPPTTTARVRDKAREVTADAQTTYDRVIALERWMGRQTEYSLDAPLSPAGEDVVDHFLFEARQGWCEQIASSLVVMLRSVGVPARLVTGYVPGEANPLWTSFTVRERDAHAWAEVWFPGIGWQPFDPTADVPLAGESPRNSLAGWLLDHGMLVLALIALVVSTAALVLAVRLGLVGRLLSRRSTPWVGRASQRLDRLGRRSRPRRPAETATAYGAVLATQVGDARLRRVGRIIDEGTFGVDVTPDADRAFVDRALHEARRDGRRERRRHWFDRARQFARTPAGGGV